MTSPEQARQDLAEILGEGRVEMNDAQTRMAERGHPAGRIDRARRALKVRMVRVGKPGSRQTFWWELPTACPTCFHPFRPDPAPASAGWYRGQAGNTDYWSDEHAPIEPPSPPADVPPLPSPPPRLEPYGPPRCTVCGKASAMAIGERCPWQLTGRRCPGAMA